MFTPWTFGQWLDGKKLRVHPKQSTTPKCHTQIQKPTSSLHESPYPPPILYLVKYFNSYTFNSPKGIPNSCSNFRIAPFFTPKTLPSNILRPIHLGPCSGWEQHVFVHTFGKVIFVEARFCNSNSFVEASKRKTLKARWRMP